MYVDFQLPVYLDGTQKKSGPASCYAMDEQPPIDARGDDDQFVSPRREHTSSPVASSAAVWNDRRDSMSPQGATHLVSTAAGPDGVPPAPRSPAEWGRVQHGQRIEHTVAGFLHHAQICIPSMDGGERRALAASARRAVRLYKSYTNRHRRVLTMEARLGLAAAAGLSASSVEMLLDALSLDAGNWHL